eukprot:gene24396-29657_t
MAKEEGSAASRNNPMALGDEDELYASLASLTECPLLVPLEDHENSATKALPLHPRQQVAGFPHALARKGPVQLYAAMAFSAMAALDRMRDGLDGMAPRERTEVEQESTRGAVPRGAATLLLADTLLGSAQTALKRRRRGAPPNSSDPDWLPRRALADPAATAAVWLAAADASWFTARHTMTSLAQEAAKRSEARTALARIVERAQTAAEAAQAETPNTSPRSHPWAPDPADAVRTGGKSLRRLTRKATEVLRVGKAGVKKVQVATKAAAQAIRGSWRKRTTTDRSIVAAGVMFPRPDKAHYGGEDAWFVASRDGTDFMGVADGVSGWNDV